jgi:hypothetical protein
MVTASKYFMAPDNTPGHLKETVLYVHNIVNSILQLYMDTSLTDKT